MGGLGGFRPGGNLTGMKSQSQNQSQNQLQSQFNHPQSQSQSEIDNLSLSGLSLGPSQDNYGGDEYKSQLMATQDGMQLSQDPSLRYDYGEQSTRAS